MDHGSVSGDVSESPRPGVWLVEGHTDHLEALVSLANARTTFKGRLLIVERHQDRVAAVAHRQGDGDVAAVRQEVGPAVRLRGRGRLGYTTVSLTSAFVPDPHQLGGRGQDRGDAPLRAAWPGLDRCRAGGAGRTVSRVLTRRGEPHLCTLDPLTGEQIRSSKVTAVRYERERPGELVHMDVKKIGRIPTAAAGAPTAEPRARPHATVRPGSGSTTSTSWSMTTPAWPTPRSSPTRRAPPAPPSWPGRSGTSPPTASPGSSG